MITIDNRIKYSKEELKDKLKQLYNTAASIQYTAHDIAGFLKGDESPEHISEEDVMSSLISTETYFRSFVSVDLLLQIKQSIASRFQKIQNTEGYDAKTMLIIKRISENIEKVIMEIIDEHLEYERYAASLLNK